VVHAPPPLEEQPIEEILEAAQKGGDVSTRLLAVSLVAAQAPNDVRVKATLTHIASYDADPAVQASAAEVLEAMKEVPPAKMEQLL
jgi:hypothetical protein